MMFPNGNEEVWVDLDDERVISTIPGTVEGKYFWTGILGFAQDEKMILLYIRKNMFLFFQQSPCHRLYVPKFPISFPVSW